MDDFDSALACADPCGSMWIRVDHCGSMWISKGHCGSPWIIMDDSELSGCSVMEAGDRSDGRCSRYLTVNDDSSSGEQTSLSAGKCEQTIRPGQGCHEK